jgi:putative hydrolase of the HAD superfamily
MKSWIFYISLLLASLSASEERVAQIVVFDFGDVIAEKFDRKSVVQFLCDSFHLSEVEFKKVSQKKKKALKKGLTEEQFWLRYAHKKKIKLPSDWALSFKAVMKSAVKVDPKMYQLVDELKEKQIPVALFSNVEAHLAHLLKEFGFYDPFSPCILSCEIRVEKPNREAYEYLLQQFDCPPESIVFIDDKRQNVKAARELGIDGIRFESAEQILKELTNRKLL